jgi:hypothetical protein
MLYNEFTHRDRAVRVRLDATASRPPGRRRDWTVEAGYWRAAAPTEKAAADALTTRLHQFLTHYEPARLLTFRGYTAVVELDLGAEDGSLCWRRRVITPDGRVSLSGFGAASWAEAEADTRTSLAHQSTDWHDDASVQDAAAYLDRGPRGDGRAGPEELYDYAAWQRAAKAATDDGRPDWHEWASAHRREFAVPRRTNETGDQSPTM